MKHLLLILSLTFAFSQTESKKIELEGISMESYLSNIFYEMSVFTSGKAAILGDFKENTQIYFTFGLGFLYPYDKCARKNLIRQQLF